MTTPHTHFERRFLYAAANFLRCRLLVMGGQVEQIEKVSEENSLEGCLRGMLDWSGALKLICREQNSLITK